MLKRNKIMKMLGIGSFCLFLLGCTKESFLIQKEASSTIVLEEVIATKEENGNRTTKQELAGEESGATEESTVSKEDTGIQEAQKFIAVHICGAVNQPGVYYVEENQRVCDGILKAGGFREDADRDYLNQALFLEDGMKITVPTLKETGEMKEQELKAEDQFIQGAGSVHTSGEKQQKVDLNTADETLLCTLPGIGKSRAQSIIDYRKEHGAFKKAQDVMKVSGIKEAAYEKIKDYVTVSQ